MIAKCVEISKSIMYPRCRLFPDIRLARQPKKGILKRETSTFDKKMLSIKAIYIPRGTPIPKSLNEMIRKEICFFSPNHELNNIPTLCKKA